jgi:hypothetical protein
MLFLLSFEYASPATPPPPFPHTTASAYLCVHMCPPPPSFFCLFGIFCLYVLSRSIYPFSPFFFNYLIGWGGPKLLQVSISPPLPPPPPPQFIYILDPLPYQLQSDDMPPSFLSLSLLALTLIARFTPPLSLAPPPLPYAAMETGGAVRARGWNLATRER